MRLTFLRTTTLSIALLTPFVGSRQATAKDDQYTLYAASGALAPNAGGQDVYSLRLYHNEGEFHGFMNRTLTAGGAPLYGAGYDLTFNACEECFWRPFVQAGAGICTAGPYLELDWGFAIPILPIWLPMSAPRFVPQIRVDFATHVIQTTSRAITWSYPLWIGLGIPF